MNPHYSGREEDKKIELSRCEQVTDYIMEMKKKGDYYYPDFVVQNISELYALLRNNLSLYVMNKTTMYMKSINFCWSLYLFGFRSFSY